MASGKRTSLWDLIKHLPAMEELENGTWVFVFVWEKTETAILCSKRETVLAYAQEFLLAWCRAMTDDDEFDEEAKDVRSLLNEERLIDAIRAWRQATGGVLLMKPVASEPSKRIERDLIVIEVA